MNIMRIVRSHVAVGTFWVILSLTFCVTDILSAPRPPLSDDCRSVPSQILGHSVEVCVVLPSSYAVSTRRFPVLFYLHGLFENEHSWIDRGGQSIYESLVTSGEAGEFIVVLPDGGKTFYVNSLDGRARYEDFFIQELVPWVDQNFRTLASRPSRGIAGDSMGGYGSLHLGMRHPELFGSVSAQSAALLAKLPDPLPTEGRWGFYARILQEPFGSPLNESYWQANSPLTLAEEPSRFSGLKLYFDCGNQDRYGFDEGAKQLDKTLAAKGFPHEFEMREGNHGWSYLNQYMKYPLIFHSKIFAAVQKTALDAPPANSRTARGAR
jgi:S-formylglutathione hydrolase FrmB